jgi:aerobic-type carbon monoxide dehydrogenase small subunit (CoxS/CutS family)
LRTALSPQARAVTEAMVKIFLTVNDRPIEAECEPRLLLSDFLRHHLGLTGTHVGCEHGVCGACTVLIDQVPARSCIMLAVQADGAEITTVEGLAGGEDGLNDAQRALGEARGLQCGFCTPGIVMSLTAALDIPDITAQEIEAFLGGHICRCTGYQGIRAAAEALARLRRT